MFSLFFKKEPTDAQIHTLYTLSVKVYKRLYGHSQKQAEELAFNSVRKWIEEEKTDIALKMLWKSKIA